MRHGGNGTFPRNWNSYLQNASNKVELFRYLSVAIAQTFFCEGKVVISTLDEEALGSPLPGAYESEYPLRPCNYDAFDTRVMLHAANAVSRGYKRILIFANDTDIIVIGISFFNAIGADKLWVLFCHVLDTYIRPEVVSQPLLLNQNTRTAYVTSAYKIVLVSQLHIIALGVAIQHTPPSLVS